jgi:hypothetical protein
MKRIICICLIVFSFTAKAQFAVNYYYDGNTIGLSTNPEKGHWFEFRVNTVSYIFSGWHYADRGITQAYYCFKLVSEQKASLYAGIGAGVPFLSNGIGWASINIPVGLQMNPFNQLPRLYLTAEYNPMFGINNDFEIVNTLSVGFRYVFGNRK